MTLIDPGPPPPHYHRLPLVATEYGFVCATPGRCCGSLRLNEHREKEKP